MLGNLVKRDLNKNMRWLWILFLSTIVVAGITRGCKELGETISFFKIVGIFFDSVFYSLLVNVILQPFLRNFLNFSKSFYSDESYLTHTLPVTKKDLINSKYITAVVEIVLGFLCIVASLLIMFGSPTMFDTIEMFLSLVISGDFSVILVLSLMVVLIIVEFLMYISIIFFSIVLGYREREKRVLKSFLFTAIFAFASLAVLSVVMVIVLLACGVEISSSNLVLLPSTLYALFITGITVYLAVTITFYFLTKWAFNKGVNVD